MGNAPLHLVITGELTVHEDEVVLLGATWSVVEDGAVVGDAAVVCVTCGL